jgi:hypothetical protein
MKANQAGPAHGLKSGVSSSSKNKEGKQKAGDPLAKPEIVQKVDACAGIQTKNGLTCECPKTPESVRLMFLVL